MKFKKQIAAVSAVAMCAVIPFAAACDSGSQTKPATEQTVAQLISSMQSQAETSDKKVDGISLNGTFSGTVSSDASSDVSFIFSAEINFTDNDMLDADFTFNSQTASSGGFTYIFVRGYDIYYIESDSEITVWNSSTTLEKYTVDEQLQAQYASAIKELSAYGDYKTLIGDVANAATEIKNNYPNALSSVLSDGSNVLSADFAAVAKKIKTQLKNAIAEIASICKTGDYGSITVAELFADPAVKNYIDNVSGLTAGANGAEIADLIEKTVMAAIAESDLSAEEIAVITRRLAELKSDMSDKKPSEALSAAADFLIKNIYGDDVHTAETTTVNELIGMITGENYTLEEYVDILNMAVNQIDSLVRINTLVFRMNFDGYNAFTGGSAALDITVNGALAGITELSSPSDGINVTAEFTYSFSPGAVIDISACTVN